MRNIIIICCMVIALGGAVYGQKGGAGVKVSIYAFDYATGHQTIFLSEGKDEVQEIKLSNANILGPFKTRLDEELHVVLRKQEKNKEGLTIYPAIAKVKIPSPIKEPLLILFPGTKAQVYRVLVVDRSVKNFPKGSYKLINFSRASIRGLVGKTKITAPPKKIISFNPSVNHEEMLNVHFQYQRASDWKTFGRTRWVNEKEKRSLLCAYLDPRTKRMKIRGLVIRPLPAKRESKQTAL